MRHQHHPHHHHCVHQNHQPCLTNLTILKQKEYQNETLTILSERIQSLS